MDWLQGESLTRLGHGNTTPICKPLSFCRPHAYNVLYPGGLLSNLTSSELYRWGNQSGGRQLTDPLVGSETLTEPLLCCRDSSVVSIGHKEWGRVPFHKFRPFLTPSFLRPEIKLSKGQEFSPGHTA